MRKTLESFGHVAKMNNEKRTVTHYGIMHKRKKSKCKIETNGVN